METLVINAHPSGDAFPWTSTTDVMASATRTRPSSSRSQSAARAPSPASSASSSAPSPTSSSPSPSRPASTAAAAPRDAPSTSRSTQRATPSAAATPPPTVADGFTPRRSAGAATAASTTTASSPASLRSDDSLVSSTDGRATSTPGSPARIKVRSLQHIQSFGSEELERMAQSQSPSASSASDGVDGVDSMPQFEISEMPVDDVIEMVAGLLTKITSTNDTQHAHMHSQIPSADGAGLLNHHAQSVLSFHGKNIPSITILSYLSRIHKYCPATYEVFLSLLVYFDRMTSAINAGPLASLEKEAQEYARQRPDAAQVPVSRAPGTDLAQDSASTATPPSSVPGRAPVLMPEQPAPPSPPLSDAELAPLSQFFVVDSFNIHRLVIAGVTCASKFFSDVFYTNSRYAKVGGLPLPELNHLELQFLLLNEFKLSITVEELEAYATMLVAFYAREIISQRRDGSMESLRPASAARGVRGQ